MVGNFIRASLLALAAAAGAQADGSLHVERKAERLIIVPAGTGEGTRALAPATHVAPGDQIIYTVSFTNTGHQPIEHASVTTDVPAGMRYVADSASGPGTEILFSVDGGATFAGPEELRFGRDTEQRPAAAEFYTDIRWTMRHPLAPGATAHARFRAVAAAAFLGSHEVMLRTTSERRRPAERWMAPDRTVDRVTVATGAAAQRVEPPDAR